jgi:signal peptidase II
VINEKAMTRDSAVGNQARRIRYLGIAAVILLADQLTKAWAVRALRQSEGITVIDGFLDFIYAENPGIAFGQLQGGGSVGRWLLAALAAVAVTGILVYFLRHAARANRLTLMACALLLGGIAGNLIDRARIGYVIDFIFVHAGDYGWPVFNIADASICAGAALLAYEAFFTKEESEVKSQESEKDIHVATRPPNPSA